MSPVFYSDHAATLDLVTSHMDVFLATGSTCSTCFHRAGIWEGLQVALGGCFAETGSRGLILALALTGAMIHFYDVRSPSG